MRGIHLEGARFLNSGDNRTHIFLRELGISDLSAAIEALENSIVGLYISSDWLSHPNGEWMAGFAWSLLTRTFRRVALTVDPRADQERAARFREIATEEAATLGSAVIGVATKTPAVTLSVGNTETEGERIWLACNGWVAEVTGTPSTIEPAQSVENPIGAYAAACLGVAAAFGRLLRRSGSGMRRSSLTKRSLEPIRLNALTYGNEPFPNPAFPEKLEAGRLTLVGCGAVGMGFLSAFHAANPQGTLTIIDADRVDETNLNRYVVATRAHVGQFKVTVAKQFLSTTNLAVIDVPFTYQVYARAIQRPNGIVICTVDNDQVRHSLQTDLPRLILEGATSGEVLSVSRYDFLKGACLGCVHPNREDALAVEEAIASKLHWPLAMVLDKFATDSPLTLEETAGVLEALGLPESRTAFLVGKPLRTVWTQEACGRLVGPAEMPEHAGAVSFVSALAGVLLAGELVKELYFVEHQVSSSLMMSALTGPSKHSIQRPGKEQNCACICSDSIMKQAYQRKHGRPQEGSD